MDQGAAAVDYGARGAGGGSNVLRMEGPRWWLRQYGNDGELRKLFEQRLAEAVSILKAAETLPEKCPRWWSVRLTTALGLSAEKEEYERLFAAAIKANPQYAGYYFDKCYYLLPRWNGEPGEWESFLSSAADRLRGVRMEICSMRRECGPCTNRGSLGIFLRIISCRGRAPTKGSR